MICERSTCGKSYRSLSFDLNTSLLIDLCSSPESRKRWFSRTILPYSERNFRNPQLWKWPGWRFSAWFVTWYSWTRGSKKHCSKHENGTTKLWTNFIGPTKWHKRISTFQSTLRREHTNDHNTETETLSVTSPMVNTEIVEKIEQQITDSFASLWWEV